MNKRILAMAMSIVCALTLLTSCGSKAPEASAPAQDPAFGADLTAFYNDMMNAAEEGPFMMDLAADAEMLEGMYPGLAAVETKQLVVASPAMSAVAIEFAFAEVANAADVETVKNIFQTRIDTQVDGGAWYPETIEGWKNNSEIVVIDNYVCMFVCAEKDGMIEALRNGTEVPAWAKAQEPAEDEFQGDVGIMDMPVMDGPAAYDPAADMPAAAPVAPEEMPVEQEPAVVEPAPGEAVEPAAPAAGASVDLKAFYEEIMASAGENAPFMMDVVMDLGAEGIEMLYPGLGAIAANQQVIYMPAMSAVACEIAMIECANAADVEAVKAIFQARIDAQVDGGAWYPETIRGWEENSDIVVNGNYVAMFVIPEGMMDAAAEFGKLF